MKTTHFKMSMKTLFPIHIKSFKGNGGAIMSFRGKGKLLNVSSPMPQHV